MKTIATLLLACVMLGMTPMAGRAQSESARYKVTFDAAWDASTPHPHPDGVDAFPASAHFSALIGAVHGAGVSFWSPGQNARPA
ncbi:MAG: hypothetical protein HC802_18720 [Caldilineaceae bacterium]|nr:hypothetical protein [Caldilineaceae bacterium]